MGASGKMKWGGGFFKPYLLKIPCAGKSMMDTGGYHMLATKRLVMHAGESIWLIYHILLGIGIPISKLPAANRAVCVAFSATSHQLRPPHIQILHERPGADIS